MEFISGHTMGEKKLCFFCLRKQIAIDGDRGIQFVSDQDDKGIDLKPDEDKDQCPDRAIDLIIVGEIVDIECKTDGADDGEDGGQGSARRKEAQFIFKRRAQPVDEADAGIIKYKGNQPPDVGREKVRIGIEADARQPFVDQRLADNDSHQRAQQQQAQ